MEVPPDSLQREEVSKNDLGRRSPWWGGRKEGTSDLKHSWSQFLVGFIHPVWWHPPDDGRLCKPVAALGEVGFVKQGGGVKGGLGNGTAPAAMVVGEAGACAGGAHPNNIKEGGRPCLILPHQPGRSPRFSKIPGD